MKYLWVVVLAILFLSGCGSSSSNNPQVSNLALTIQGTGTVNAALHFNDNGGDVSTITMLLCSANGTQLSTSTTPVSGVTGRASGTLQGSIDLSNLPPGDYSLKFYITDSHGSKSNIISQGFSSIGALGTAVPYPNSSDFLFLGDTAIGDLNGDGRNDVVAIQGSNNSGEVFIYYQNASGTLDSPVVMNLDILPSGIAIADVNNDGKKDLILSGISSSAVTGRGRLAVLLQDPATGQLGTPQEYTISSDQVGALAVGDLNGDGRNDIVVVAPQPDGQGNLSTFFQNALGTLNPEVIYNQVPVKYRGEIHLADMNGDGTTDIVVQTGMKQFAVIYGTTPGGFSLAPDFYTVQTSYWPDFEAFALGDVNGDGRIDVVTVDPGNDGYINIFLQNSHGTLDPAKLVNQPYESPFGVKIADVTGDGLNDIVYDMSGGIAVLQQQKDHTFGSQFFYPYQSGYSGGSLVHQALSIGDVTGDGRMDMVVTWIDGLYLFPFSTQLIANGNPSAANSAGTHRLTPAFSSVKWSLQK